MTKSTIALIVLASAAAFSGTARADDFVTASNQESARVARESAGVFIGGLDGVPQLHGQMSHTQAGRIPAGHAAAQPSFSAEDRFLFALGDRGKDNG